MSKILSEEREEVVYRVKRKVAGVECDRCGKVIKAPETYGDVDLTRYFNVMTGHRDWGNDSCESIKHEHICPDCIVNFVERYLEENSDSNTAYIEIETDYIGMKEYEYE